MKRKYMLFFVALGMLFVLGACGNREVSKDDATYNEEVSEQLSDSEDHIDENAYFISTNDDFYETIAGNPVDRKYVIEADAAPLEIWQLSLEKCEAWNQQIDFTVENLKDLLEKEDEEQLQKAIVFWHDYYQEEVEQNRDLYGNTGIILGSMYTATSADVLVEKCKLVSVSLLSLEYELTGKVSFKEDTTSADNGKEYSVLPEMFCIEYSSDFENTLSEYAINEKDSDEFVSLIQNTANKIEENFGHDFTEHANKYVSFIQTLYSVENDVSENQEQSLVLEKNRLKLYATELVNIKYMLDEQ